MESQRLSDFTIGAKCFEQFQNNNSFKCIIIVGPSTARRHATDVQHELLLRLETLRETQHLKPLIKLMLNIVVLVCVRVGGLVGACGEGRRREMSGVVGRCRTILEEVSGGSRGNSLLVDRMCSFGTLTCLGA